MRTTSWNLVFHYLAIAITFINGVVLVPLYLVKIPLETYGYWLATGNILAWLSLVDPGFSAIVQQRVAASHGAGDRTLVGRYIMAGILIAAGMAIGVGLLGGLASFFLADLLGAESFVQWREFQVAYNWAVAGTLLSIASFSLTAGGMGLQGALGPGIVYTVTQVSALLLTIYWLHVGYGIKALGLGQFVRGLGLCVGAMVYLGWRLQREGIPCRFSRDALRELLCLSGFTFLAKMPGTLAAQLDVLLAARFLGPEAAAMFGLTRRGFDISRMLGERPTVALMPAVSHVAGEGNYARLSHLVPRMSRWTVWVLALLFGGSVALNDDFLRLWIGEGHYAGWLVNLLFAASMVLGVVTSSCSNVGFALGDVKGNSVANLKQSALIISALCVAAPTGSMVALATPPLLGTIFIGLRYFPQAMHRRLDLPVTAWRGFGRECILSFVLCGGLAVLGQFLHPDGWLQLLVYAAVFCAVFVAGLLGLSSDARRETSFLLGKMGKPSVENMKARI